MVLFEHGNESSVYFIDGLIALINHLGYEFNQRCAEADFMINVLD
jgi:hypothetical protein